MVLGAGEAWGRVDGWSGRAGAVCGGAPALGPWCCLWRWRGGGSVPPWVLGLSLGLVVWGLCGGLACPGGPGVPMAMFSLGLGNSLGIR